MELEKDVVQEMRSRYDIIPEKKRNLTDKESTREKAKGPRTT